MSYQIVNCVEIQILAFDNKNYNRVIFITQLIRLQYLISILALEIVFWFLKLQ